MQCLVKGTVFQKVLLCHRTALGNWRAAQRMYNLLLLVVIKEDQESRLPLRRAIIIRN